MFTKLKGQCSNNYFESIKQHTNMYKLYQKIIKWPIYEKKPQKKSPIKLHAYLSKQTNQTSFKSGWKVCCGHVLLRASHEIK